jgi:glycosyltransferase involved in cell wall biosynthesis
MNKPTVYMLTQDIDIDRRILLEAGSLQDAGYAVTILATSELDADRALNLPAGAAAEQIDGVTIERIKTVGQDPRYRWVYRLGRRLGQRTQRFDMVTVALLGALNGYNTYSRLAPYYAAHANADIYTAHDLNTLQPAMLAAHANHAAVVYDAHELYPEVNERLIRLRRGYWRKVEARLLSKCDAASTVNEFIAEEMAKRYHVPPPTVIYNATNPSPGFDPTSPADHLRTDLSISKERRIALFQGGMTEGRGLEKLVLAAQLLPDNIVIVLMGGGRYRTTLERLAAEAGVQDKVYFRDAVPQSKLVEYCTSADVGLITYQAVDLNNYYCSPNKLFDYIVAGLPIIANDLPFLRKMITTYGLGLIGDMNTPEQIAILISRLLGDDALLAQTRANLLVAAKVYNWTNEGKKVVAMYERVRQQVGP